MRALAYRARRRIISDLYLALNSALSAPLIAKGIAGREARDIISVWSLVVSNHAQNHKSTAHEIAQKLNISRGTVNRRLETMQKLGYLTFEGSHCHLSDQYAARPMMSLDEIANIEAIINRAHDDLQQLANGKRKTHNNNHSVGGGRSDDQPQASRRDHRRSSGG